MEEKILSFLTKEKVTESEYKELYRNTKESNKKYPQKKMEKKMNEYFVKELKIDLASPNSSLEGLNKLMNLKVKDIFKILKKVKKSFEKEKKTKRKKRSKKTGGKNNFNIYRFLMNGGGISSISKAVKGKLTYPKYKMILSFLREQIKNYLVKNKIPKKKWKKHLKESKIKDLFLIFK